MKAFTAVALAVFVSPGASAQRRAVTSAPAVRPAPVSPQRMASPIVVPSAGALGGNFASSGMSRPLGGIAPSSLTSVANQRRRSTGSFGYVGPIYYVPNAYDTGYQSSGYSTFNQPANPALYYSPALAAQSAAPPVVINQYFGLRHSNTQTEDGNTTTSTETNDTNPGDPLGTPQKYYLIAYKDHSVYSAMAYWLESDTLHYVTTQNTHNQASLALIDLDQTTKLNADNSVPFSLAGK
jgi:hypothetical protein